MLAKKIIAAALGLFVVSSLVFLVVTESPVTAPPSSSESEPPQDKEEINSSDAASTTTSSASDTAIENAASANPQTEQATNTSNTDKAPLKLQKIVQGLYFHGRNRCYTCNVMEGYIRDVIKSDFSKETKEGRLTFESINVEDPMNRHYIMDYQLQSISFFLALKNGDKKIKHANADKIWTLARDEMAFKNYIKLEIKRFLEL